MNYSKVLFIYLLFFCVCHLSIFLSLLIVEIDKMYSIYSLWAINEVKWIHQRQPYVPYSWLYSRIMEFRVHGPCNMDIKTIKIKLWSIVISSRGANIWPEGDKFYIYAHTITRVDVNTFRIWDQFKI